MSSRILYDQARMEIMLLRLAHQLLENYQDFSDACLLGIQPRGVLLGRRLHALLTRLSPHKPIDYGELDVTFHRDDFRRYEHPLVPNSTHVDFILEGKRVVLVDDVLYTGRTIRAAMDAMLAFGRPQAVELAVLVDRKHMRHLPIEAHYRGISIDTLHNERVRVEWAEQHGQDLICIEELEPAHAG